MNQEYLLAIQRLEPIIYNWLVKELTKNNVHEGWNDYQDFINYFKENQTWSN